MSALTDAQHRFMTLLAELLPWALAWCAAQGYTLTGRELWRPPETARQYASSGAGIAASLHCDSLAIDLLLRRDGRAVTDSARYEPLGRYWEGLDPDCSWGGRMKRRDGGHFSLGYGGRQ